VRSSTAPAKPVAEITVDVPILDIEEITLHVERWQGDECVGTIWSRPGSRG
jgi:hypothetical protein